ncbi:hypothetical protein [Paenibacillus pabuli]|uniref:hypothetical protein n=1 Tax=Paenibacillus pabuli TaxID=1472 RepID=UPI000782A6B7|nr:hypothetical protein [Paenibacillus pabuli]MEC0123454.1 hypothetical protein [Paenibacillus pabuli]
MNKKVALSILSLALSFSAVNVGYAAELTSSVVQTVDAKQITEVLSEKINEPTQALSSFSSGLKKVGQLEDNGWYDETTKEIDSQKLREAYLNFFNSDPIKYADSIKDVDILVENTIASTTNSAQSSLVSPSSVAAVNSLVKLYGSWKSGPSVTKSTNMVTYTNNWLTEDNYRSSVPIKVSSTKRTKISATLGFSGSIEVKNKFGFSGSFTAEQETTVSQGADVPGWTAWGYRPYIRWIEDSYSGVYTTTYTVVPGGSIFTEDTTETGVNKRLSVKSNEYWSVVNTNKSTSASTPLPPSGAPK